ncbi:MAG TPA: FHA domain-containing protein, partial [Candidatus Brocadiia bacterium]|nr:FHA domain-containing protein [Candidatus Brocadiia bacterium]
GKETEPSFELVDGPAASPLPAAAPKSPAKKKDDSSDLDIPADVEVDAAPETLLDLSLAAPAAHAAKTPAAPSRGQKPAIYGAGELTVTCIEGGNQGASWKIDQPNMIMGRDRKAAISIRDLAVSRQHASIVIGPRGVEIRDLGSHNGIYVNGQKSSSSVLKPGDTIRIGQSVFLVDFTP